MKHPLPLATILVASLVTFSSAQAAADVYGPFPVTVKGYSGKKTDSTAYTGQMARHLLHNSLKITCTALCKGGCCGVLHERIPTCAFLHDRFNFQSIHVGFQTLLSRLLLESCVATTQI